MIKKTTYPTTRASRLYNVALAAAALSIAAPFTVSCGVFDGGAGGGSTSGGPGSSGVTAGSGGAACVGGCMANEVCDAGACVPIPEHCPCPQGSYCDLGTDTCVAGCMADSDCNMWYYCEQASHLCLEGCRDNQQCGTGTTCADHQCKGGCKKAADCENEDETCVDGLCTCPDGTLLCGTACTEIGTIRDCAGCGDACPDGAECQAGVCHCDPGHCGATVLVDLGDTKLGAFDLDDSTLYFVEASQSINRMPSLGGPINLVLNEPNWVRNIKVAGSDLVYIWMDQASFSHRHLKKVPVVGSFGTSLDGDSDQFTSGDLLAVRDTGNAWVAYWWANEAVTGIKVSDAAHVAKWNQGFLGPSAIVVAGADVYHGRGAWGGDDHTIYKNSSWFTSVSGVTDTGAMELTVNKSAELYFSAAESGSISRIQLNAKTLVISGQTHLLAVAADDTTLYWLRELDNGGYELARGPKGGGAVKVLHTGSPMDQSPRGLVVNGQYLYWADNNRILMLAK